MPIKYFEYFKRKLFFPKKFGKSYEDNFQSKLLLKKKLGLHGLLLCFICCIDFAFKMHFDVALNWNEK